MKSPKFAFQLLDSHDSKGGAFFVRKVEIVSIYPHTRTAGIRVNVNGRSVLHFADFDSLASTERKAARMLFERLRQFPAESTVSKSVGAGSSEKQTATAALPCAAVA